MTFFVVSLHQNQINNMFNKKITIMKENIQNLEQQKTAKNLKKVQNLKVAVATALGLTAGTGVVIAGDQLLNNEDMVAEPSVEKEEVAVAAKPKPQPETKHEEIGKVEIHIKIDGPNPPQPEKIPAFAVLEREAYIDEEGNFVEIACGVTEGGHACVVIDEGMTGFADLFWEDENDDLDFQEEEFINLAENGIEMNMADLIDFSEYFDAEDAEDDTVGFAEIVDDPVVVDNPFVVDDPDTVADVYDQVADVLEPEEPESFEPVIEESLMAEDTPAVDENVADNDYLANL